MHKLPLHPLTFVVAYVVLTGVATQPMVLGIEGAILFAVFGVLAAFLLHSMWMLQAIAVSERVLGDQSHVSPLRYSKIARSLLVLAVVGYAGSILTAIFGPSLWVGSHSVVPAFSILGIISFFMLCVVAARAVCIAEETSGIHRVGRIGTFFLFFYIALGAFFIYGRLRSLMQTSMPSA